MSEWRVTARNPVRNLGRLDYERCAALHNEIVERGWTQAGRDISLLSRRTLWDTDRDALKEISGVLDPSIVEFYKLAMADYRNVPSTEGSPSHNFFRVASDLAFPDFENANTDMDSNEHRFLEMYRTSLVTTVSHASGLNFDQERFLAIFQVDLDDSGTTMNGRVPWLPLETILDGWLSMMDEGKVVALKDEPPEGAQEWEEPWIMLPYSVTDLKASLETFEKLVEAIESRMPPASLTSESITYGYFASEDDVPSSMPPNGFARNFLTAARKPRFRFIAPGLEFDPSHQPFELDEPTYEGHIRPVLLARGAEIALEDTELSYNGTTKSTLSFKAEIPNTPTFPCGLYLTETRPLDGHPFEDGCRLMLPYKIGMNGWARRSDNSYLGERQGLDGSDRPQPTSTELFQRGFNPFTEMHDTQLKHIIEQWVEMVESEHWQVDSQGVAGGMQKWREADTQEHWEKYQLPIHW